MVVRLAMGLKMALGGGQSIITEVLSGSKYLLILQRLRTHHLCVFLVTQTWQDRNHALHGMWA